jgi:hypothetical protein
LHLDWTPGGMGYWLYWQGNSNGLCCALVNCCGWLHLDWTLAYGVLVVLAGEQHGLWCALVVLWIVALGLDTRTWGLCCIGAGEQHGVCCAWAMLWMVALGLDTRTWGLWCCIGAVVVTATRRSLPRSLLTIKYHEPPPCIYVFQGALEVLATLPTQNVTVAELPGLAKNYSKHVIYVCQVRGKKKTTKTQQHTCTHT